MIVAKKQQKNRKKKQIQTAKFALGFHIYTSLLPLLLIFEDQTHFNHERDDRGNKNKGIYNMV